MKIAWLVVVCCAAIVAAASYMTAGGEAGGSSTRYGRNADAVLRDTTGARIGTVKLEQRGDSVNLKVAIERGVAPGFHGFHIHAAGA